MIEKVQSLVSIGKFRNYQAAGVVSFKKLTLIYAENGSGKTTLTRVIKSLCDNDPALIHKRISTSATTSQSAQIWSQNPPGSRITHNFNGTSWNRKLDNVEIFDIHFVNDNVYSGFEFSDDHKKRLHQFVIGAQGVALHTQIEQNKKDKTAKRVLLDGLEQQLINQVGNGLTETMITSYLQLSNVAVPNIAQNIIDARRDLQSAQGNTAIQSLQQLQPLPLISGSFDFDSYEIQIANDTHQIQDSTLKALFEDHCLELSTNGISVPADWLLTGYEYIKKKHEHTPINCPFCKQELTNQLDIFNAYVQRFNDAFNSYISEIYTASQKIRNFNIDTFIQMTNERCATNSTALTSWNVHLPNATTPSFLIFSNEAAFRAKYELVLSDFEEKIKNPSLAISPINIQEFRAMLNDINTRIRACNLEVSNYNGEITRFKSSIQTTADAQNKLNILLRTQSRSLPAIDTLCTQIKQARLDLATLRNAYTPLVQAQEAAVSAFFTTYGTRVNHYLNTIFKTPFQITNVAQISPQGQAVHSKLGFGLTISGQPISHDPNVATNLKDTLSEGDKSTIAFAFFLAKLDIDTTIADKIIVFDDPLSSFDRNRKSYTISLLRALEQKAKQLVVLSHNENFLYELSTTKINAGLKATLWISYNFTLGTSEIKPLDLDEMVENDYFKQIKELDDFMSAPTITKKDYILGLIRTVLEAHIKFKFHRQLLTSGGGPTFGALIGRLQNASVTFRDTNTADVYRVLNQLNDVSWRSHHGTVQPTYPVGGIDPNSMTITELASCITDTFDLIENRL